MLPFKVAIFDRRLAFIPLNPQRPEGETLLVRSSALLNALYMLFECLWERATPIACSPGGAPKISRAASRVPEAATRLIALLSAGLNEKAIAHELNVWAATLNRRLADLMKVLDTRTRFQMGWRAALEAFPERTRARR